MEGQPNQGQSNQGQSNGSSQFQVNQLQQMQNNFQQQFQNMQNSNMSLNQLGQQMGGQIIWPLQQNQNQSTNNNGVINATGQQMLFNQMNWQQQSQNQPSGGDPPGNPVLNRGVGNSTVGNSTAVPMSNVVQFQGAAAQAPAGGGIQNPTNNAPPSLNQQQAQAQTALWLNAFRAFQGAQNALPNGGGNVLQGGNTQVTNNMNGVTTESSAQPQMDQTASQATSAPNAFIGGNTGGNQGINQMNQSQMQMNFSQMYANQLQAQMNPNQTQQSTQSNANSGKPSSFGFNSSNQMNTNTQQQTNLPINGNPNNTSSLTAQYSNPNGNVSNQTHWLPQGNIMATNNPSSNDQQQLLVQQFLQKQQIGDGNSGTNVKVNTGGNCDGYPNQLNAHQQVQQSIANSTINGNSALHSETRCQVSAPALTAHADITGHAQQVRGTIMPSHPEGNMGSNPNQEASLMNAPQLIDPNIAKLSSPDPIVTGGKVHATSFSLTVALGRQIEGEKVNDQVEGICVQGGSGGHGRCLDGNFAGKNCLTFHS